MEREVATGRVVLAPSDDYSARDKIKGCTEIVNCISDNQGNVLKSFDGSLEMGHMVRGPQISLLVGESGIDVKLSRDADPCFKVVDVRIGPFDL